MDMVPSSVMVVNCGCIIAAQVSQENLSRIGVVKIANTYVPAIQHWYYIRSIKLVTVAFNNDIVLVIVFFLVFQLNVICITYILIYKSTTIWKLL